MPEVESSLWPMNLVELNYLADLVVTFAYILIPLVLFFYAQRREDLGLKPVYFFFALFSISWGILYLGEQWNILWPGHDAVETCFKALIALAALYTIFLILTLFPAALLIPNPFEQLKEIERMKRSAKDLQDKNLALAACVKDYETELEKRTVLLTTLGTEKNALNEEIQRLNTQFSSREAELNLRVSELTAQNNEALVRHAELNSSNLSLQAELNALKATFQSELAAANAALQAESAKRQQAEDESARYASIVSNLPDSLVTLSVDGVIASSNRVAEQIYGRSAAETNGLSFKNLVPEDRLDEDQQVFQRAMGGNVMARHETVRLSRDGTRVPVVETVIPIRNASGSITGAAQIVHDLSQLKKAEDALRESQAREEALRYELETLLEALPAPVWISRQAESLEIRGNRKAHEILGLSNSGYLPGATTQIDPRRLWFILGQDEAAPVDHPMQVACRTKRTILRQEVEVRQPYGPSRFMSGTATPLLDATGNIRGSLGAFIDITDLKHSQEKNKKLQADLERSQQQVAELTKKLTTTRRDLNAHENFAGAMKLAMRYFLDLPPAQTSAGSLPA